MRRPKGYWKSLENYLAEARTAIQENGWTTLPSPDKPRKNGYSSIANGARRYHRGMPGLRKLLQKHMNQPSEQEQLEVLVGGYHG